MLGNTTQGSHRIHPENSSGFVNLTELTSGFLPAFRNLINNETHLSMTDEGTVAPEHRFDNLPIDWVCEWGEDGYAKSLLPTIMAGYIRADQFYTIPELIQMPMDA